LFTKAKILISQVYQDLGLQAYIRSIPCEVLTFTCTIIGACLRYIG